MQEITIQLVQNLEESFLEKKIEEKMTKGVTKVKHNFFNSFTQPEFFNPDIVIDFVIKNPDDFKTVKIDLLEEYGVSIDLTPDAQLNVNKVNDLKEMEELLFALEISE